MTSPTNLPDASLARIYSPVRAGDRIRSGIRRSLTFGTICFLASFSILVGSSLFTFGMSYPIEAIQHHKHAKQFSESYDGVYLSLQDNVMQSLQPQQLTVGSFSELFMSEKLLSSDSPASNQQFASSHLHGMVQGNPCAGRCLDPHPGAFRFWYGQQNGCWIQVWRAWPEGCQHYQWYNSCNGYWDSYPNGAPRVFWNCCVH